MARPSVPTPDDHSSSLDPDLAHALLTTAAAVIVLLDRAGRVVYLNPAGEQLGGYPLAELRDQPLWDRLLLPNEAARMRAAFADLRAGHFPNTHQNHWRTRWGEERLLTWANTALTDDDGAVRHVVGIGIDVTEERTGELRFRAIFDAAAVPLTLADAERRIIACNAAYERFSGYSARELRAGVFPLATHPDDAARDMDLYQALVRGDRASYILVKRYIRKDGEEVWGRLTAIAVPTTTGTLAHTVGMVEDITAQKDLEAALADAEHRLTELRAVVAQQAEELARLRSGLTKTEWRVLRLLAEGLTNAQIAARLNVAPSTVKTHIHHLREKLRVDDRHGLVTLAREWIEK